MPHRSSVKKLPPDLRAEVDRLLLDGRHTLDQIIAHLRELDADAAPSRSALGRYARAFDEAMADVRLTREMATAAVRDLPVDGDATSLVVESLHALLLKSRLQLADAAELKPRDVADLARAAKDLGAALKTRIDAEIRAKRDLAQLISARAEAAAEAVTAIARQAGVSAERIAEIRRGVLGIRVNA